MRLPFVLVGALAAPSLVGCAVSAPDPGPESTSPSSTPATAVVEVERTTGPGDSARTDAVAARVVRVKQGAVDDSALRIAGVSDDLPNAGCFVPTDTNAVNPGRSVELLDVGPVTMTSDGAKNALMMNPRTMPDPAGVVSGFFYSTRSADAFAAGSKVIFKTAGSPDLPEGFTVSVNAPKDLTDVRALFGNDGALDVAWDATEADARDVVYADVLSPAPRIVLRCVANDTGHLVVPAQSLAGIDDGQLAVHRLHRESFRAKGIDPGEVRFDVAKVITFRR